MFLTTFQSVKLSVKFPTLDLLKIKTVIISVHDVTNKILVSDSNQIVDVII